LAKEEKGEIVPPSAGPEEGPIWTGKKDPNKKVSRVKEGEKKAQAIPEGSQIKPKAWTCPPKG